MKENERPVNTEPAGTGASGPDFSRHLVECWGKLSLARPQSAPVIWA